MAGKTHSISIQLVLQPENKLGGFFYLFLFIFIFFNFFLARFTVAYLFVSALKAIWFSINIAFK